MSLKKFFSNLNLLRKIELKRLNNIESRNKVLLDNMYIDIIDQLMYELPKGNVKRPLIKDYNQTVDTLISSDKSIARFGDGEIKIISGESIEFQEYDAYLATRLKSILENKNDRVMVGINYDYYYPDIQLLLPTVACFYRINSPKLRKNMNPYLNWNSQYYSAAFTQLYMFYQNMDFDTYFEKLRQIWNKKDVLIVACKELVNTIKYNIFDNANKTDYFFAPNKNAFSKYDEIYKGIKNYSNKTLVILMLGPTAKVLADDLSKDGYRALDLGHLMKDYDWYKKGMNRDFEGINNYMSMDK
ncbi:GT-D fold domain-containing glycosyltransferase [Succinivibrio faecicola]|uniref:DUF1792 domain-containing protein n=1 Tax=Succinivibrio faecicola TaxID=2820300 RepID=A0ABS7DGY3_9GAMM|nr:GT-D fold domain-containing glycosyltransferase [Succinivibrio faecicola]MBW7570549.1 DUF1792 domain-containing protein [Succinivibrio faecicola]